MFRDGVPVASLEKGVVVTRSNADADTMAAAADLLYGPIRPAGLFNTSLATPSNRPHDPRGRCRTTRSWDPVPATRFNLN